MVPRNNLARMLVIIGVCLTLITLYAQYRGPDCDSGTTDSFSPDLREDQITFLEANFPEDFDGRSKSSETLLAVLSFADPFSKATSSAAADAERKMFVDVGSNRGSFAFDVLTHWGNQRMRDNDLRLKSLGIDGASKQAAYPDPIVHAFDLSENRVEMLRKIASTLPTGTLVVHHNAVSDAVGTVQYAESDEGPTLGVGKPAGKVESTTIDTFVKDNKIGKLALVNIDVDGFESPVLQGALNSIRRGVMQQLIFVYGHLWKKEYTGRREDFTLHALAMQLFELKMECYIVAKHRLIKISGDYWDDRFELHTRFKYVSVDVWCVHHESQVRTRVLDIYNAPYEIEDYFD